MGDALIAVGMIGTIVFGIWLALDEYEIWDGWIITALVLWLLAAAVGGRVGKVYNATRDRAKALPARAATRRARAERHAAVAARPRSSTRSWSCSPWSSSW